MFKFKGARAETERKKLCAETVMRKIFETYSSVLVRYRNTGKVRFPLFRVVR